MEAPTTASTVEEMRSSQMSNLKRAREETPTNKYATNPLFIHYLTKLKAEQIPIHDGRIFVAQRTDGVVAVWKGLMQHNFLSVPVLQKTKGKFYGFLDILDIVKFVVQHFGRVKLQNFTDNFWKLVDQEELFQKKNVNDIMTYPLSLRNPFHPVVKGFSAFSVIELLARERGLHRVPIVNRERQLVHMVTQSQVVELMFKNLDCLGDVKNKPLHQFQDLTVDVICVKESDIALDAFMVMVERNVTGVAIVDDEGRLIGNLSLRDIKLINADASLFFRLFQTVKNYIAKLKKEGDTRPPKVVCAKKEDSLEYVLRELQENQVHRIYVVDDNKKPIGVVALKDLLHEVISS